MSGNASLDVGRLVGNELGQRRMLAFHHIIRLGDMDAVAESAEDPGKALIYLQDYNVRPVHNPFHRSSGAGQVEVSVPVHGGDCHHGHIDGQEMLIVRHHVVEHHGDVVAQAPVAELPLVLGAVPGIVDKVFSGRVALHRLYRAEQKISPNLYIVQLFFSSGQRSIQQLRECQ